MGMALGRDPLTFFGDRCPQGLSKSRIPGVRGEKTLVSGKKTVFFGRALRRMRLDFRSGEDVRRLFSMSDIATNRKAKRDYHITDTYEAGMELLGTEVKSIRLGHVNLSEAYARVDKGQLWLYNCDIRPYEQASHEFHAPLRHRRLLLHKREIRRMAAITEQQGLTIVPLRLYWKNRRVKIEIGIGRGKDQRDKRHDLKEKVTKREVDREIARFNR